MLYGEGLTTVLRCCFFLGSQLEATSNVKVKESIFRGKKFEELL